jgi:hypothetical protein
MLLYAMIQVFTSGLLPMCNVEYMNTIIRRKAQNIQGLDAQFL